MTQNAPRVSIPSASDTSSIREQVAALAKTSAAYGQDPGGFGCTVAALEEGALRDERRIAQLHDGSVVLEDRPSGGTWAILGLGRSATLRESTDMLSIA